MASEKEPIKVTRDKLRKHGQIMTLMKEENPRIYEFHRAEYQRLRQIVLEHEARQKPLPLAVRESRDRRWARYGTLGSLAFAKTCIQSTRHRRLGAGEEVQQLAIRIEQDLEQLINLLRKELTHD